MVPHVSRAAQSMDQEVQCYPSPGSTVSVTEVQESSSSSVSVPKVQECSGSSVPTTQEHSSGFIPVDEPDLPADISIGRFACQSPLSASIQDVVSSTRLP